MAERQPDGTSFPPELRSPEAFGGCRYRWHCARMDWLKENGLKGVLSEIRALTNPALSDRLVADPDASIGGPRRLYPR
jgi:hypothetical protein